MWEMYWNRGWEDVLTKLRRLLQSVRSEATHLALIKDWESWEELASLHLTLISSDPRALRDPWERLTLVSNLPTECWSNFCLITFNDEELITSQSSITEENRTEWSPGSLCKKEKARWEPVRVIGSRNAQACVVPWPSSIRKVFLVS